MVIMLNTLQEQLACRWIYGYRQLKVIRPATVTYDKQNPYTTKCRYTISSHFLFKGKPYTTFLSTVL